MALRGNLQDMTVADLIQHNCLDGKTARLVIEHDGQEAHLFFKKGAVTDATLGELQGEEAVYRLLSWQDGKFTLEADLESPSVTINRSWSSLLLEGARLLDEGLLFANNGAEALPEFMGSGDSGARQKKERLSQILADVILGGTDIEGGAVIGIEGTVYAAEIADQILAKQNDIGPLGAAIWGLSRRSVEQLRRGNFNQTLIQGDQGNIIISSLKDEFMLVCLIPIDVSLGIVFSEVQTVTKMLHSVL